MVSTSTTMNTKTEETPFVAKQLPVVATNAQKWWFAIVAGLLFALISSPFVYGITNSFLGKTTTVGGPTFWGILLHTIVYILLLRLLLL